MCDTFVAIGPAAPCTGVFKPVWMEGQVLPGLGAAPGGKYDPDALWWYHERLHRSVLMNYNERLAAYRKATERWTKQVQSLPGRRRPGYIYRKYWEKQNAKAGIHLP